MQNHTDLSSSKAVQAATTHQTDTVQCWRLDSRKNTTTSVACYASSTVIGLTEPGQ